MVRSTSPTPARNTADADPPGWSSFAAKFQSVLGKLRRLKRGCLHCLSGSCYTALEGQEQQIRRFRLELHALESDALRDQHLAYLFGRPGHSDISNAPEVNARLDTSSESETEHGKQRVLGQAPGGKGATTMEQQLVRNDTSEDESCPARCDTSPTSGSPAELSDLEPSRQRRRLDVGQPVKPAPKPKRRLQRARKQRYSMTFLGHQVCFQAALVFVGVGSGRLRRIKEGRRDGRRDGTKRVRGPGGLNPSARAMPSVLRFLWRLYHSVGEGMPDRFTFDRCDLDTLSVQPTGAPHPKAKAKKKPVQPAAVVPLAPEEEEQERSIVAATLYAETTRMPAQAIQAGPGMPQGPLRFLPPQKRIHVYWEHLAWCNSQGQQPASFHTFLRAFQGCREKLRIRKAGSHATCDTCAALKARIRAARFPKERQAAMEEYTKHVLSQWLDRQIYWHAQELSLSCRDFLRSGHRLATLARSVSQICLIADGMDQAKFRAPRVLQKTHALDKLLRPALHVQGAWCHGFGYHLAVADTDMRKDTNNNVEVMARLLSQVYLKHGGLPLSIHIQQDNTSRECKNQLILRFACKLVALGIFQSVTLAYLVTGHTHENIDGSYGQLAVKIAALEFDDDVALVSILLRLLGQLGVDPDSRLASKAYKLDEAACWTEWWDETSLVFSKVTGPEAPHWFRFCALRDLGSQGSEEKAVPLRSLPGLPLPDMDDVVMVVKERMASPDVLQVLRVFSAADRGRLTRMQPAGLHPRRPDSGDAKVKVARVARELHQAGAIRDAAADYLIGWAEGTRRREPRPESYAFLKHRWQQAALVQPGHPRLPPRPPRLVEVRGMGGRLLPMGVDQDDAEPGPLIAVEA